VHKLKVVRSRLATGEPVWTQKTLRHALAARGLRPRKGFGQHFLVDPNCCRVIVRAAELPPGADVLEIGAGPGLLTVHLAPAAGRVTAVEIDPDMAALCRVALSGAPNVAVLESSILDDRARIAPAVTLALSNSPTLSLSYSPTLPLHIFGNLPYNLSVSILIALLDWARPVDQILIVVQREVGERLRARPGEDPYGPLSAVAQAFSDVKVLRAIPARVFWPAPRVESALVRLCPKPIAAGRARPTWDFLQRLFQARRKRLGNVLKAMALSERSIAAACGRASASPDDRAERLSPETLATLAACLVQPDAENS
jgi:16S rRNA (adenine1518-N6/adenine1519-N6)-dimethyltransferase